MSEEIWLKEGELLKVIKADKIIEGLENNRYKWVKVIGTIFTAVEDLRLQIKRKYVLPKDEILLLEKKLLDLKNKKSLSFLDGGLIIRTEFGNLEFNKKKTLKLIYNSNAKKEGELNEKRKREKYFRK